MFHLLHCLFGVFIEHTVSVAEVVFAIFARIIVDKTVFRALSVAEVIELTMSTFAWQEGSFSYTELKLAVAVCQVGESVGMDISNLILGIYEVVAAVDVAVVFYGKTAAAGLAEGADGWLHAHFEGECGIKELYISSADVVFYPYIEDVAHKLSKASGADRPRSYIGFLCLRGLYSAVTEQLCYGQELHKDTYASEEVVYLGSAPLAVNIYRCQGVVLHAVAV